MFELQARRDVRRLQYRVVRWAAYWSAIMIPGPVPTQHKRSSTPTVSYAYTSGYDCNSYSRVRSPEYLHSHCTVPVKHMTQMCNVLRMSVCLHSVRYLYHTTLSNPAPEPTCKVLTKSAIANHANNHSTYLGCDESQG